MRPPPLKTNASALRSIAVSWRVASALLLAGCGGSPRQPSDPGEPAGTAAPPAPRPRPPDRRLSLPKSPAQDSCRAAPPWPRDPAPGPAAAPPDEIRLGRPRRLWRDVSHLAGDEGIAVAGGVVYSLHSGEQGLLAMDAATGELLWKAPLTVSTRRQCPTDRCDRVSVEGALAIARTGETLLTGIDIQDGTVIWRREEACAEGMGRSHTLLDCAGQRDLGTHVIETATGASEGAFEGDDILLSSIEGDALFVAADDGCALHRIDIPGWRLDWTVPVETPIAGVLAARDGVLLVGRKLRGRSPATGALRFEIALDGDGEGPFLTPRVAGDRVWGISGGALRSWDPKTGAEATAWPLPGGIEPSVRARDAELLISETHVVLATRNGFEPSGALVVWALRDPVPVVLRRPNILAGSLFLTRGMLVGFDARDALLTVHSLTEIEPPLAALPLEEAIAIVEEEMAPVERLLLETLLRLPGIEEAFARWAAGPPSEHRVLGIRGLRFRRSPAALDLLNRLADRKVPEALGTLAAYDDPQVSRRFARQLKRGKGVSAWQREAMLHQLWRTGRTAALGLCRPGTRKVKALKADGSGDIGTAHPALLDEVAPDGRWLTVCQARRDTDGDGRIRAAFDGLGGLGGPGDETRPYLVVGDGPGYPVDELLGADGAGRFVAVRQGACLAILDTERREETVIPDADLRDSRLTGGRRPVSFDGGGRVVYIRTEGEGQVAVVRDLETGAEEIVDPGEGEILAVTLDSRGEWLTFRMADTRDGFRLPAPLAERRCRGMDAAFEPDDAPVFETRVVRLSRPTRIQRVDTLVYPLGERLITRRADGALALGGPAGEDAVSWVPAGCRGELRYATPAGDAVVVSCGAEGAGQYQLCRVGSGCRDLGPMPAIPGPGFFHGMGDRNDPLVGLLLDPERGAWVAIDQLMDNRRVYRDGREAGRLDGARLEGAADNAEPLSEGVMGPLRWTKPGP